MFLKLFRRRGGLLPGAVVLVGFAATAHAQFNPAVTSARAKAQKATPAPKREEAPVAQPEPIPAKVFFYRENLDPQGIGRRAMIYVDGHEVVNLGAGKYFLVQMPAGQHTFSGPDQQQAAPMDVQPGQDYYFKAKVDRSSAKKFVAIHNAFRIDLINPKLGEIDVAKLKPQDAETVPKGPRPTGTAY